jgi:hypothetical protein
MLHVQTALALILSAAVIWFNKVMDSQHVLLAFLEYTRLLNTLLHYHQQQFIRPCSVLLKMTMNAE